MTVRKCPNCGRMSLRVVNVMSTTETIHWRCGECCHKEQTGYNYEMVASGKQQPLVGEP
jgi:hypothetical protein